MNSTIFTIAAGLAIAEWCKTHVEGCVLSLDGPVVLCSALVRGASLCDNPLQISSFEVANGMKSSRWNTIGTELMNLFNKELACQTRQKH